MPAIKKKYLLHHDFSNVSMEKLASDYGDDGWIKLSCEMMQSEWIEKLGKGKFKFHQLPLLAQVAPINSILPFDADGDGNMDLIISGNEYQTEVMTGRYDAFYGLILKGNGKGESTPIDIKKSGFITDGDVKDLKSVTIKGEGKIILAAINDAEVKCFNLNKKK